MMKSSVAVLLVLFGVAYGSGHWGYFKENGPLTWLASYPICAGSLQSPINIESALTVEEEIAPFVFTGYDDLSANLTLTNNGHSAQLSTSGTPFITGGGLDETFHFQQLHFHWGNDSSKGSEHTVNGKQYPAEVHFVHWRESFGTFANAAGLSGGLAIIGALFEVSEQDNPAIDNLINALALVEFDDEVTTVDPFVLNALLPSNKDCFYRYSGSLTTPECNESGIWTLMVNTIPISEKQLNAFRELNFNAEGEEDLPMVDNFRNIQKLNSRVVSKSKCAAETTTASSNIFKRLFKRIFRG
jgi:carbonic anhydrase